MSFLSKVFRRSSTGSRSTDSKSIATVLVVAESNFAIENRMEITSFPNDQTLTEKGVVSNGELCQFVEKNPPRIELTREVTGSELDQLCSDLAKGAKWVKHISPTGKLARFTVVVLFGDQSPERKNAATEKPQTADPDFADMWVPYVAKLSAAAAAGSVAPQVVLFCPTAEMAFQVATECPDNVLNQVRGAAHSLRFRDGTGAAQFPLMDGACAAQCAQELFQNPGYAGRGLVITNGFVSPVTKEERRMLLELLGAESAIEIGVALVW